MSIARSITRRTLMLLALLTPLPSGAQRAGITTLPDSVVTQIDRAFASLGGAGVPGCAIGISQAGVPVLTRAYGSANLEYDVPNTPETIFESGSVAKQFTAASVVLLAQDGRLSLDDDIRKHLPEVPDFGKRITIRNLLTHTSGLRDQWGLLGIKGSPPGTQVHSLPMILDLVSRQKSLNFEPGAEYLYSNTGYALAAIIVQRASGRSLAQFSEERLFRPLGMTHTRWRDDFTRVVKNRATAYNGTVQSGFTTDMPFTNVYGNGGLLTTVGDLLTWNAFLDAPSAQVGGPALVRTIETPMTLTSGRRSTYALGLEIRTPDGIREVTHGGATAGYRTWLARFPDQKVSVAVLCNVSSANPTRLGAQAVSLLVPRVVSPAVAGPVGSPASPTDLERYVGVFRAPSTQNVVRTAVRDGKLVTDLPVSSSLTPTAADRFRIPGQGELVYRFTGGRIREVLVVGGDDTTRYEPVAAMRPTPSQLAAYAGSYWSDELDTRLSIAVRDSAIVVRRRAADEVVLRPMFTDAFTGPNVGTVVFSRDGRGAVDGFGIWAGRVRNVRFVKEK